MRNHVSKRRCAGRAKRSRRSALLPTELAAALPGRVGDAVQDGPPPRGAPGGAKPGRDPRAAQQRDRSPRTARAGPDRRAGPPGSTTLSLLVDLVFVRAGEAWTARLQRIESERASERSCSFAASRSQQRPERAEAASHVAVQRPNLDQPSTRIVPQSAAHADAVTEDRHVAQTDVLRLLPAARRCTSNRYGRSRTRRTGS